MATPDLVVEIGFESAPLDDVQVWEDVSDFVELQENVKHTHGRSDEFDQPQVGELELVFNNEDGRFSPSNVSSPYYPNVIDGKKIRARAIWDEETYDLYTGYVDKWPVEWENGAAGRAVTSVTASDRFKRLSTTGELLSVLEHEVLKDEPELYFTLGEDSDSARAGNTALTDRPSAVKKIVGSATIEFGSGTWPGTEELAPAVWDSARDDDDKAIHTPAHSAWLYVPLEPRITFDAASDGFTFECWAKFATEVTKKSFRLMNIFDRSKVGAAMSASDQVFGGVSFGVNIDDNLYTFIRGDDQSHENIPYTGDTYVDGEWHHFTAVYEPNTTNIRIRFYVDGVEVFTDTYGNSSTEMPCDTLHIGEDRHPDDGDSFLGEMGHVAVYTKALSGTRIAEHYSAGLTAYAGETAGERITRIAEYADVSASQANIEDGASLFGPMQYRGSGAVEALQDVAETENGVVFVNRSGELTFHGRTHRYNQSPVLTLDAADNVLGEDTVFAYDDTYTRNDIYITQDEGPALRRKDQASIDARGRYREDLDMNAWTVEDAIDAVEYRLQAYSTPRPRVSQFTLRPHEYPELFPALLALEIGDKIRLENLPSNGPVNAVDLWVEGYTETIGVGSWEIELTTSPVLEGQQVWRLGVNGESTLGSTAVLGYGTVSPAIPDDEIPGPRTWVDEDDYPSAALFNVEIRDMIRRLIEPPEINLLRLNNQPVNDSTGTWVEWDFAEVKRGLHHSSNEDERPDQVDIVIPGIYLIQANLRYEPESGSPTGRRDMSVWVNLDLATPAQANIRQPGTTTTSRLSITTTYELFAGDTVRIRTYQTSQETLNLQGGFCSLSMKWIGEPT